MKAQVALLGFLAPALVAQGPNLSYLADPGTDLSFAECHVYLDGGSRHKIPFLPVVNAKGAPCGTQRYTQDIRLKAPIAFAGNGAGAEAYGILNVAGTVVLLGYDFPDGNGASLEERVREAVGRKAAGVVLFSVREDHPFPRFREEAPERIPEIPVIAIGKRDAAMILASAGRDADQLFRTWETDRRVRPEMLIAKLDLRIDGKFRMIETANFTFAFEPRGIAQDDAAALAETGEKAVQFDLDLFRETEPRWKKVFTAYFADFDSKLFFLHHWGKGLSGDAGMFMVYDGQKPDFGLAAHETAHALIGQNWGGSSSFLSEGIGKYAEAMATDKVKNHRETLANLRAGKLFPLEEMAKIQIGSDARTAVAYPAAGSFVQFLIDKYSLRKLKAAYQGGGSPAAWIAAYGKTLPDLEREFLEFLRGGQF
jgi:hypothetical protein